MVPPFAQRCSGPRLDLHLRFKVYGEAVTTYTIGEMAQRSGFSASALRCYEDVGLVAPATRTAAGYRLFEDDSLARLTFIARAKRCAARWEESPAWQTGRLTAGEVADRVAAMAEGYGADEAHTRTALLLVPDRSRLSQ